MTNWTLKRVEYAYFSSLNATRLGFGKTGCFCVELGTAEHKPFKAVNGYPTLEQARAHAESLPLAWSRYTK